MEVNQNKKERFPFVPNYAAIANTLSFWTPFNLPTQGFSRSTGEKKKKKKKGRYFPMLIEAK